MSRFAPHGSVVESLESRRLMAATISGAVMRDMTGNGLSADDQGLAGVVVKLYRDRNANSLVDAADGAALATKTSAAVTGAFSFSVAAKGKYLLQETVGANQVRTGPFLTDTIAVNVTKTTKKSVYGGNIFANYVKDFDRSAVSGITYTINGGAPVATMDGNVHQGDTVTVHFTVAAGKTVTVSLVSYKAPEPFSTAENLQFQELFQADTGTFTGGTHSLTVEVPDCYFQLDFIGGLPIDPFGPAGSDTLYARQGRRIAFVNGGTEPCDCDVPPVCEPPPCEPQPPCNEPPPCEPPPCEEQTGNEGLTPGFWKNHTELWVGYATTQTLESVFDVPDSLGLDDKTLLEALNFGGGPGAKGAAQNLFRHAVAALLNARHSLVEYPLTASIIVSRVNTALATDSASAMSSLKDELDTLNNLGGGIDAHGRAI